MKQPWEIRCRKTLVGMKNLRRKKPVDDGDGTNTNNDTTNALGEEGTTPAIREVLHRMAETEAERRVAVAENLKDWVTGQERLLVGSETATSLAWLEVQKASETSSGEENGAVQQNGRGRSQSEIQRRRKQILSEVQQVLAEKWTAEIAQDWVDGASRPEDTLQLMDEVFGLDTYLESPHVVSAAVGEWWKVKQPRTGIDDEDDEYDSQAHVALVIVSSGPQLHIYNLKTAVVVLDLETPPQDALLELLSGNTFPAPTLSIPLSDARIRMTDDVDVMEVVPTTLTAKFPRIRLLCPHLNNIC
jgi:hypothetical protein